MLVWSAVLNGIVAVPIMAMMMLVVSNDRLMGRFKARPWLIALGWLGTALMALAVAASDRIVRDRLRRPAAAPSP